MKRFWKITGRVLCVLVLLAIAAIVFRLFLMSDESALKQLSVNSALREAYASHGEEDGAFALKHDVPYQISEEDGYFAAYAFTYIPSARQLQLVIRLSDYVPKKLGVAGDTEFLFVLRNGTTGEEWVPTGTESAERWMYRYRRLVFDGITVNGEDDLWIDMRLSEDGETINKLVCHFAAQYGNMKIYRLSASEKTALKARE